MDLPFDRTRRRRIHLMRHADAEYISPDGTRAPDSRVVRAHLNRIGRPLLIEDDAPAFWEVAADA